MSVALVLTVTLELPNGEIFAIIIDPALMVTSLLKELELLKVKSPDPFFVKAPAVITEPLLISPPELVLIVKEPPFRSIELLTSIVAALRTKFRSTPSPVIPLLIIIVPPVSVNVAPEKLFG